MRELLHNSSSKVAKVLEGFAVGDGCVGTSVLCGPNGPGPYFRLEFLHGHGQFSHKLFSQIHHHCPREQLIGYNGLQITDPKCKALVDAAYAQVRFSHLYTIPWKHCRLAARDPFLPAVQRGD